jgi:hypothetical protein
MEHKSRIITEKIIEKEMYKVINDSPAYLGNVSFKLI